ncbi:MAG: hypothetical protein J7497_13280, partial [Chitinophagaceae bacterium]|nr:hypothetical protein [Chitinophagaceae bacterium]
RQGVLNGKLTWYEQKENFLAYYTVYLEKLDTYGFDKLGVGNTSYPSVNANCWFLFLRIEDKALLNRAANWMEKLIAIHPDPAWIDTYANLLYKSGDKERAISWEEKALAIVIEKQWQSDIDQFSQTLSKMRRNETTW